MAAMPSRPGVAASAALESMAAFIEASREKPGRVPGFFSSAWPGCGPGPPQAGRQVRGQPGSVGAARRLPRQNG